MVDRAVDLTGESPGKPLMFPWVALTYEGDENLEPGTQSFGTVKAQPSCAIPISMTPISQRGTSEAQV